MSSLDRLLKAFESVRLLHQDGLVVERDASLETITSKDSTSLSKEENRSNIFPYSGTTLLSKKDGNLSTRDKLLLCQSISESVISGFKSGSEAQTLISLGIETLIILQNDKDQDVRMNSDEALNRVIRSMPETHVGKILVELFKEIKRNGPVHSLRAALNKFGILCHYIRPQKCRAYIQNLLPSFGRIARRAEESLLETFSLSLERILPVLGQFTNDGEIKNLLRCLLPNAMGESASVRRSAVSSLMLLCLNSRKPCYFLGWLLDAVLCMIIPITDDASSGLILGVMMVIRNIAPHLQMMTENTNHRDSGKLSSQISENVLTFDRTIQIYELVLTNCQNSTDHNIVTASLEALLALLQSQCCYVEAILTSPEGILSSRIRCEMSSRMVSRASSLSSLMTLPVDEIECLSLVPEISIAKGVEELFEDEGGGSLESMMPSPQTINREENANRPIDVIEDEDEVMTQGIYAQIDIGQIEDESILFGRSNLDVDSNSSKQSRHSQLNKVEMEEVEKSLKVLDLSKNDETRILGDIGSLFSAEIPLYYLVRFLSSAFLLSGRKGCLLSDREAKVSHKALALNCIGNIVTIHPDVMSIAVFIDDKRDVPTQYVCDLILYQHHSDPQLSFGACLTIGNFLRGSLAVNGGCHVDFGKHELKIGCLLDQLCDLLLHESSVTVRGAITGLNSCILEIFHSMNCYLLPNVINRLIFVVNNSYWLVKVELCNLLSLLPLYYIETEDESIHLKLDVNPSKPSFFCHYHTINNRILELVFVPLLGDHDHRVRGAAVRAVRKLSKNLMSSQDPMKICACFSTPPGSLTQNLNMSSREKCLIPPFDKSVRYLHWSCNSNDGNNQILIPQIFVERHRMNCESLSRLVQTFSNKLFLSASSKFVRLGCLEILSSLCCENPPALYPAAWGCGLNYSKESQLVNPVGIAGIVLSLIGEANLAGDIGAHCHILFIVSNWMAGRAVYVMDIDKGSKKEAVRSSNIQTSWEFLKSPQVANMASSFVTHLIRVLCIYVHVLEDVQPGIRPSLVPGSVAALSPIRRKSRTEFTSERTAGHKATTKETDDKEKRLKVGSLGSFCHLPEYIRLYDSIKSAHTNYKISLESSPKEKFLSLLQEGLSSLGLLMEISSMVEFGRLAEELLYYFKSTTSVEPTQTILCGQQLLKCLFGSNIAACCYQQDEFEEPIISTNSQLFQTSSRMEEMLLFSLSLSSPLSQLKEEMKVKMEPRKEPNHRTIPILRRKESFGSLKLSSKTADKMSLSSYIRLFEPLVIKALKLYTISSDVIMQKSVLNLLIHLVEIRVNYCLLDSEQIFIGYVIKQFEFIEEGQIKCSSELIPAMFRFLVLLSYERHHSKSIIGVPKIIRLCDGLMASGQPPLDHCILALKPLVEDLFLDRIHILSIDQKELETQREVICSFLLRMAQYHQVLSLLSIVLISTEKQNQEKWTILSKQIVDVMLPLLSKLVINVDSKESLSAIDSIFNNICPSIYSPPDALIKIMLATPSIEMENTETVCRWVGGVLLLLKTLLCHCSFDTILSRLNHLGLSMSYNSECMESSFSSLLLTSMESSSESSSQAFGDPLNVNLPDVKPEDALARFLFDVIRVCASEMRTIHLSRLGKGGSGWNLVDHIMTHITYHFLLTLYHMSQNIECCAVIKSLTKLVNKSHVQRGEVSSMFLFVAPWVPSLALVWCHLLTNLEIADQQLWMSVLHTKKRNVAVSASIDSCPVGEESLCLNMQFLRRMGFITFCQFVVKHMCEGEWFTWLVVDHVNDLVILQKEPPVKELIESICNSSSASALLLQAVQARCENVHQAVFGSKLLTLLSGIHPNQSAPLVRFLIEKMMPADLLMISRFASFLCIKRLQLLLANTIDKELQLTTGELEKLILFMAERGMSRRYSLVNSLLQQLYRVNRHDTSVIIEKQITDHICHTSTDKNNFQATLNMDWFIKLATDRCMPGVGNGSECCRLLLRLNYEATLKIMSSPKFDLVILLCALREIRLHYLSDIAALYETSKEVAKSDTSKPETFQSLIEKCDNIDKSPFHLYKACQVVLFEQLNKYCELIQITHHSLFCPDGNNKYSKNLLKFFDRQPSLPSAVNILCSAVVEFLQLHQSFSSEKSIYLGNTNLFIRFAVVCLELLHFLFWKQNVGISTLASCLSCVNAILKDNDIFSQINSYEDSSLVSSMAHELHHIIVCLVKPFEIPRIPQMLANCLEDDIKMISSKYLMQIIMWMEIGGLASLPHVLSKNIHGLVVSLSRLRVFNNFVRLPSELWNLGWSPEITPEPVLSLPPIPFELLQEADILKGFIYRLNLLGFTGRQQFEETWMIFLSVLNSTPNQDTAKEETPYINFALKLAIRGITSLLMQTLLMPYPGCPQSSTLVSISRDALPVYFTSGGGKRLQSTMLKMHESLHSVHHLTRGKNKMSTYRAGQLSVEYMVSLLSELSADDVTCFESYSDVQFRERQLKITGLDVKSCLHFLHYLYSSWLIPKSQLASSLISEVCKSISILCDLFTSTSHHIWVLESLIPLYASHAAEDQVTTQYIIVAICKAFATLSKAEQSIGTTLTEGVFHAVELGLQHQQINVRTCALHGLLYCLQAHEFINAQFIGIACNYIIRWNDGKTVESETHIIAIWEMWFYLVENYDDLPDPTLSSAALQMALSTAASTTTAPRVLQCVLKGVERLVLVQHMTPSTLEVVLKLVMDLVLNGSATTCISALPLFITSLYVTTESVNIDDSSSMENESDENRTLASHSSDPEALLQSLERLSVLFDRLRQGFPYEASVIGAILPQCLLDLMPPSQIMNKVITEYISSHQPHPSLLAITLFSVFEAATVECGHQLVQDWVLLSLGNFTQRSPVGLAVWCLTCFFICASKDPLLRAVFPSVVSRRGMTEPKDIEIFCLAAKGFRQALKTDESKAKFDDVFQTASRTAPPFAKLIEYISSMKDE